MIKKIGKALPYALAGAIAFSSLTGCSENIQKDKKDMKNQGKYSSSVALPEMTDEEIYQAALHGREEVIVASDAPTVTPSEPVLPVLLDAYQHLEKIYKEENLDVSQVINMTDESIEKKASCLYEYLKLFNVDQEEAKKELENVLAAGCVYLCDFKSYNDLLFKNLAKTISDDKNVVDFYYPLACYVHLYDCNEEHTYDENGRIACPIIDAKIDELNFNEFLTGYVIADIGCMPETAEVRQARDRILNSDVDVNLAFTQLENIIMVGAIPTDYTEEEWQMLFSELLKTVSPYENVCEVYYDLALHYHGLNCDYDHEVNEFDRLVCPKYKKLYK